MHRTAASNTHRVAVPVGPDTIEERAAMLWQAGALGVLEQTDHLVAWFRDRVDGVPPGATWSIEPDRDWQAEWKATIEPVRAGRITIVPTWLAQEHRPDGTGTLTLVLDPGRAFGTGHHATTTQCLELLDSLNLHGRTVADVGCGSGILAIAAAMRGARALAVDIDPDAVAVTRDNAARNGVEVEARVGSVRVLPDNADVVVANLLTDVVVALAPELVGAARETLIISGVSSDGRTRATRALIGAGAIIEEVLERDGWLAIRAGIPAAGQSPAAEAPASRDGRG